LFIVHYVPFKIQNSKYLWTTMAPVMATTRLRKELLRLQKEPLPGIIAEPDESNILKWHYAIQGPSETSFQGGIYVGKLVFATDYPMKGPSISMLTPNGRFKTNMRLCMSMSDFHPESWNPMWSVSSIIQGIQSFMASTELTTGGLKSPESEHKRLAAVSMDYNKKMFPNLFGGDIEAAMAVAEKASIEAEKNAPSAANTTTSSRRSRTRSSKASTTKKESDTEAKEAESEKEKEAMTQQEELTPEEIEKRRKRNAKKRAKQKEKKSAQQAPDEGNEAEEKD
jgi:ubiquitin-conjugating enzyme E2 J2